MDWIEPKSLISQDKHRALVDYIVKNDLAYLYELLGEIDLSNYLAKDNVTVFTPDADYEPATKKYVDDTVGSPPLVIQIKTTTYGILATDDVIICNSATAFTVTLPTASGSGKLVEVKNINSGVVTIEGASSDTIDGDLNIAILQWESVSLVDYAANKWVIV